MLGGGAAGFFGAIACAEANPTISVVLLEKTGKLLGKVMRGPAETIVREMLLISGTSGLREYAEKKVRAAG